MARVSLSVGRVLVLLGLGAAFAFSCTPPDRGIVVDGSLGGGAGDGPSAGGASGGEGGGSTGGGSTGGRSSGGQGGEGTGGGSGGGEPVDCEESSECPSVAEAICDEDVGECRSCQENQECATARPDTPYCDEGGVCVECRNGAHCPADAFVCEDGTCRGCEEHSECESLVCLPDGTCEDQANIVYALPESGINGTCGGRQDPCLLLEDAVELLGAWRPYLVFLPSSATFEAPNDTLALPDDIDVTILGNSVEMVVNMTPVFEIDGGNVILDGLVVTGNVDEQADPTLLLVNAFDGDLIVRNSVFRGAHTGIQARDATLEVTDSEFSAIIEQAVIVSCSDDCTGVGPTLVHHNRFTEFPGGGVSTPVPGSQIVNNFFYDVAYNTIGSAIGVGGPESIIAHNTLIGSGVCTFPALIVCWGGPDTADTLLRGNVTYQTGIRSSCNGAVYGMCTRGPEYSVMETTIPGTGNYTGDPSFVDAAGGDYRLAADSPAVDLVPSDLGVVDDDFEGNERPAGDGYDAGAYERQ